MKNKETRLIQTEYTRCLRAISKLQLDISILDQIEYKLNVYSLLHRKSKVNKMHDDLKIKIKSMETAKNNLYTTCDIYKRLMKKFDIGVPSISTALDGNMTIKKLKKKDKENQNGYNEYL